VILPAFVWISEFVIYHTHTHTHRTKIEDVLNRVLTEVSGTKKEEARGVWRQLYKEDLYSF